MTNKIKEKLRIKAERLKLYVSKMDFIAAKAARSDIKASERAKVAHLVFEEAWRRSQEVKIAADDALAEYEAAMKEISP